MRSAARSARVERAQPGEGPGREQERVARQERA